MPMFQGMEPTPAPISHPRINGLLGIPSSESKENTKELNRCQRFSLDLFLPDDKKFPEFDYGTLIKKKGTDDEDSNVSKIIGFDADDTDDLKALALKYEAKYAPKKKDGGKKHKDEFVDCGYGYDETDTFIDNSEAYDEVVPSDWTTEHGGFYINQGNLDFRPCLSSETSKKDHAVYKKKKKKKLLDGKMVKTPKELTTQKKKIQLLNKEKQRKRQESLHKATKFLVKKNKKPSNSILFGNEPQNKENNTTIDDATFSNSFEEDNVPLAKIARSSEDDEPLAKLSGSFDENVPLAEIKSGKAQAIQNGVISSKPTTNTHKTLGLTSKSLTTSSCSVSIKNVLSSSTSNIAANVPGKVSCTTAATCEGVKKVTSSPLNTCLGKKLTENIDSASPTLVEDGDDVSRESKEIVPLPDVPLCQELRDEIQTLKDMAAKYVKGKGFFTAEVNKVLLSFARYCRQLSPKIRNGVYDHILCFIPCARDTLVKRCRRLIVQHQRDLEDEPIRILKAAIDESMLTQRKEYEEEVAEALQEQAREQIKQTGVDPMKADAGKEGADEEVKQTEDTKKVLPKKKYEWSDSVRNLLIGVVKVRVGLYKMSKSKSLTPEEYIKDFLESEIRKLWPKGWMTSRILYKESRAAHVEITQPYGKSKSKVLPSGHIIADVRNGASAQVETNALPSGPKSNPTKTQPAVLKTVVTITPTLATVSHASTALPTTPVVTINKVICNGTPGSTPSPKQSLASHTVKIVPKSVTKTITTITVTKTSNSSSNAGSNLLTITKPSTSSNIFGNIVVTNSLKSSTGVTWNSSSSLVSTSSVSPLKHSASNNLATSLKIVGHGKARGEVSARFAEAMEKSTLSKPTDSHEEVSRRQVNVPLKVDSILSAASGEKALKAFRSSTSSSSTAPLPTTTTNVPRSSVIQQSSNHHPISSGFSQHTAETFLTNSKNEYLRQKKRKLPEEGYDHPGVGGMVHKRPICDQNIAKATEGRTWMEVESDLARMSKEPNNPKTVIYIKDEPESPDSGVSSGRSPAASPVTKGPVHSTYPTQQGVNLTQGKMMSPPTPDTRPGDVTKTKTGRLQSTYRSTEATIFETESLSKTSVNSSILNQQSPSNYNSHQHKYIISSKQSSPLNKQSTPLNKQTSPLNKQVSSQAQLLKHLSPQSQFSKQLSPPPSQHRLSPQSQLSKQLSPKGQLVGYQQGISIPYTKPATAVTHSSHPPSQLSIKSSGKSTLVDSTKMRMDHLVLQHPAVSRGQIPNSMSDHHRSAAFETNTRSVIQQPINVSKEDNHVLSKTSNKAPHHAQQQKQQQQQQQRSTVQTASHGVQAGIQMAGKYMVSMTSPVSQPLPINTRVSVEDEDERTNARLDQDYSSTIGSYTQRFS